MNKGVVFIEPSVEHISRENLDELAFLERVGRTCYKSEDAITADSKYRFVDLLNKRGHLAMLEHVTYTFKITEQNTISMLISSLTFAECYSDRYIIWSTEENGDGSLAMYITFSYTALRKFLQEYVLRVRQFDNIAVNTAFEDDFTMSDIMHTTFIYLKEMMQLAEPYFYDMLKDVNLDGVLDDDIPFINGVTQLSYKEICELPMCIQKFHRFESFKVITNRGVSHEFVRHRDASYAQESTRYINYTKENKGGVYQILDFINEYNYNLSNPVDKQKYDLRMASYEQVWETYKSLIELGDTPNEARGVLQNDMKTELIATMSLHNWEWFITMREPATAHCQIRPVAKVIKETLGL